MSTNVFGQGMKSYNNTLTSTLRGTSWKGDGVYSYPVAITSGNIRPLTNNDLTNNIWQKHGLPRPLKWQYRKGTVTHPQITVINPNKPNEYIEVSRISHTSKMNSLIGQTMDQPGRFSVKHNPQTEKNENLQMNTDCQASYGVGLVASFSPEHFLTNNPQPCVTNPGLCCNQEVKAKRRVIYANTNLPQNYYNTHYQYLQNRCQTYQQKAFNFQGHLGNNGNAKPGSPQALSNTYIANCYPNVDELTYSQMNIVNKIYLLLKSQPGIFTEKDITRYNTQLVDTLYKMNNYLTLIEGNKERALIIYYNFIANPYVGVPLNGPSNPRGCKNVIYKPSNPQFAVEGGVSSSTRLLKLTTDTISTNIASIRRLNGSSSSARMGYHPFIYKNKYTTCQNSNTTYMRPPGRSHKYCTINNTAENQRVRAVSQIGNIGGDRDAQLRQ